MLYHRIVYHRTDAADAILRQGFRDSIGYFGLDITIRGVFVSDAPLDLSDEANGNQLLAIKLPADVDLLDFELFEDMKPYRKWCVPASVLNSSRVTVQLVEHDAGA